MPAFAEGQDISSQALEIVILRADLRMLEDASPEALLRKHTDHRSHNTNNSGSFGSRFRASAAYGFQHTLYHLPSESGLYFAAVAGSAVYDCKIKIKDHPMACPLFGQSLKDPLTHLSFFLFMGTNHSTSHFLNAGGPSFIPRSAITYIGMAAGSFVSGLSIDFLQDPNIKYIREHFFKEKTPIEKEQFAQAFQNAYEKFVLDPLHISYHTPHLVSLVLSSFLASATHKFISSTFAISGSLARNVSYRLADRIERQPITFVSSRRNPQVLRQSARNYLARRIILPPLKFVVRVSPQAVMAVPGVGPVLGVTMRIGHLLLFFAWDNVLHPPIRRAYDLNRITSRLNNEKASILYHLTSSYQEENSDDLSNTYNAAGFLSIFSLTWWQGQRQRARNHSQFLNTQNTLTNFINRRNLDPNNVPTFFDPDEPILSNTPNLIEHIETDNFVGETQRARGDVLLDHILRFNSRVQEYRQSLSSEIDITIEEWKAFFEPFFGELHTASNFYGYLIETQGQLHFENETPPFPYAPELVNKSRGMLDALYFSSRSLNESNTLSTLRLFNESKFLHFGVQPQVVHKLSNQDLESIARRLATENTFSGRVPTNEHLYLIDYLNFGFDVSRVSDFNEFDFQVRREALRDPFIMGLKVEVLDTKSTQEIYEMMQFLKDQSEGDRPHYIRLANEGRDFNELYQIANRRDFDRLYRSDQIIQTENPQEENTDEESLESNEVAAISTNIVQRGARYFDNSWYPNPLTKKHYGIMYFSTLEKLLISVVCGESLEELQSSSDLARRSAFGLGALEFNAPRLWPDTPTFCQEIRHVHQGFVAKENGQDVFYHNLLDYVSQNIGSLITIDEFQEFWNKTVLPAAAPVLSEYTNMKVAALAEDMSDVYNNTSYGYDYSDPGYTEDFPTSGYARGIYQFERDITNYYLNLLVSLLPVEDADFVSNLRSHLNTIRSLSLEPDPRIHEALSPVLRSTYQLIEEELRPQNPNNVLLLRVTSAILAKVRESVLHSSQKSFLTLL